MSTTITKLKVLVDREGGIKIPTEIFEWELPILEDIHAAEGSLVQEIDSYQISADIDAVRAHEMIMSKYDQAGPNSIARNHYRSPRDIARKYGLPMGDLDHQRAQSHVSTPNPAREKFLAEQSSRIAAQEAAQQAEDDEGAEIDAGESDKQFAGTSTGASASDPGGDSDGGSGEDAAA